MLYRFAVYLGLFIGSWVLVGGIAVLVIAYGADLIERAY